MPAHHRRGGRQEVSGSWGSVAGSAASHWSGTGDPGPEFNRPAGGGWQDRGGGQLTREQFGDGLVLTTRRADEEEPRGQELVVAGQELGDGPGGARGGPLLPLDQLTAFIDGVHQQEERLLGGLHAQERQEDTSEDRGGADVTSRHRTDRQRSQMFPESLKNKEEAEVPSAHPWKTAAEERFLPFPVHPSQTVGTVGV